MSLPFYTGNDITPQQANFNQNVKQTTPVGSYPPNPWGLYDMAGNVFEWTDSVWADNYSLAMLRANKSDSSSMRVVRGGSLYNGPLGLCSAARGRFTPDNHFNFLGFRLSRM